VANDDHVAQLKKGVIAWNAWHDENHTVRPDLRGANLSGVRLRGADLTRADFRGADLARAHLTGANFLRANLSAANLRGADLRGASLHLAELREANLFTADLRMADLTGADFTGANFLLAKLGNANLSDAELHGANLSRADLSGANLSRANFVRANLLETKLTGAELRGASLLWANLSGAHLIKTDLGGVNLEGAALVGTDLTGADLTGCRIYGISAWRVKLDGATQQQNLIITPEDEPEITVDNIEVAQFIDLLLHNQKIRHVIDTITSKVVLILGRFTDERKAVLDALREELRKRDYLPVLFDFEKPKNRTTDETITLLARVARFVIADLSDAKSVLQELRGIVPALPSVPIQPLILTPQDEPGMLDFYQDMSWFLKVHRYDNQEQLIADLGERVIRPAETKVQELRGLSRGTFGP
jgi:uncharacterized protein YjbI with pentapeptide repeats